MKLLTSGEYQRSLEDLLGVPTDVGARVANHDGRRGGFVDMAGKPVSSTLLDTYVRNAADVAGWAVANERPFACGDATSCGNRFVDEFLFALFRGPISRDQADAYRALITDTGDLGLALEAALTILAAARHKTTRLKVATGFHSKCIEPCLPALRHIAARVSTTPDAGAPVFSTLTGGRLD